MLYTDFYSGYEFIESVERLLEYDLESIPSEYYTIYSVPLNRKTLPMYEKNKEIINESQYKNLFLSHILFSNKSFFKLATLNLLYFNKYFKSDFLSIIN